MQKPRVFVTRKIPAAGLDKVLAACDADVWSEQLPPARGTFLEKVRGCVGLLSLLTEKIDAEVMDAAGPQLKVISNFAVYFGTYSTADSRPAWTSWTVRDLQGSSFAMNALFLHQDVAIMEVRGTPSATRVQRLLMVRTLCDFRYSDTDTEAVDGCRWLPMRGELLRDAYLSGECAEGLSCFRLVSDLYFLYAQ